MRLSGLTILNFRSIKKIASLRIEPLQSFVGENDAGKSNILRALNCFLTTGVAGVDETDFNDPQQRIQIEAEFTALSAAEKKKLRPYLIGDKLILQKTFTIDPESKKGKVQAEYHGYQAEPADWWLSIPKIHDQRGARPRWAEIAAEHGLTRYVADAAGNVTKATYEKGLEAFLSEQENVAYDQPELGRTQALGIQQNLLSSLPKFYLLPAITDYRSEIDSRSSTTVFRRLMADLSERLICKDPRYAEVEAALSTLHRLLNPQQRDNRNTRLASMAAIENQILQTVKRLMPNVEGVQLGVDVGEADSVFSRGVKIRIDDGTVTDVEDKGNGMQRCIVFSLLQLLMDSDRKAREGRPIILGIEEPELYIHPQSQRLIFTVLKEFAGIQANDDPAKGTDQVIYTTHSPAFVEVGRYEQIGCVRKESTEVGTVVKQCQPGVLGTMEERKGFKLLTSFGLSHNEMFFSRHSILVEGEEDKIGVISCARKLRKFVELPDECRMSIIVVGNKEEIPKFQKLLNAFGLQYSLLLEMDGHDENHDRNRPLIALLNGNLVSRIPSKLEAVVALGKEHFKDPFEAKIFFANEANITPEWERIVEALFPEGRRQENAALANPG